ncbi:hypothetical protein sscle_12g091610 [Sclerotinia sclerotiorum 1980 UF-70]|uniref:Uncharacterized protein n=1 Tax=Sclerotinia sclerotiorum (strain ATCC 18683 / 1980 / Ss-1) TaxID=665079 RepID=A0A1D9QHL5_SCLS1|nr:hypothetical protein sscle_12g091610 [Sclerotinia sclerotiorum 1980 UF-70]
MRATFYQLVVLSLGLVAIAAPLGNFDSSIVRATDGDEYVRWPDNGVDENGLLVAAYEDSNTT